MSDFTCLRHQRSLSGFFGTFDGLICLSRPLNALRTEMGARILNHELSHFFQNYFTASGLSFFGIVALLNRCLQDFLSESPEVVHSPMMEWLPNSGCLRMDGHSLSAYDGAARLLMQLGTASNSSRVIRNLCLQSDSGATAAAIRHGKLALDADSVAVRVGDSFSLPIDYQAICESMALAQELSFAGSYRVRKDHSERRPLTTAEGSMVPQAIASCMTGGLLYEVSNLQYTFPLLLLLQSGYNAVESVLLTTLISFIALCSHFVLPGVTQLGAARPTWFGRTVSRTYVHLLDCALRDRFLDNLNLLSSPAIAKETTARYLDRFTGQGTVSLFSDSQAALVEVLSALTAESASSDWLATYHARRCNDAVALAHWLQEAPLAEGLATIMNPQEYLIANGAMPVAFAESEFVNLGALPQTSWEEVMMATLGLHAGRCVLLGRDEFSEALGRTDLYQKALTARFLVPYGVRVHGWTMAEPPQDL